MVAYKIQYVRLSGIILGADNIWTCFWSAVVLRATDIQYLWLGVCEMDDIGISCLIVVIELVIFIVYMISGGD